MFESIAIVVVALLAAGLVFFKARERLKTPGARRSRRDGGGDSGGGRDADGGDGGGGGD